MALTRQILQTWHCWRVNTGNATSIESAAASELFQTPVKILARTLTPLGRLTISQFPIGGIYLFSVLSKLYPVNLIRFRTLGWGAQTPTVLRQAGQTSPDLGPTQVRLLIGRAGAK